MCRFPLKSAQLPVVIPRADFCSVGPGLPPAGPTGFPLPRLQHGGVWRGGGVEEEGEIENEGEEGVPCTVPLRAQSSR